MIVVVFLITFLISFVIAFAARRHRGGEIDSGVLIQDILIAGGTATAIGVGLYPIGAVTYAYITNGNKLQNAIAGFDPNALIISMVIGTVVTTVLTLWEYYKRVSGRAELEAMAAHRLAAMDKDGPEQLDP